MKKSTKIILSIIIITLTVALCIMTYLFEYAKKTNNDNMQKLLEAGNTIFDLNCKIEELEEKLENATMSTSNSAQIATITNTTRRSTSSYTPPGIPSVDKEEEDKREPEPLPEYNRDPNLVTLEVDKDTLSKIGVTLVITDNNEPSYGWGEGYSIQKKTSNGWADLEAEQDPIFTSIGYVLDENNQFNYKIDWSKYYGKLSNGTYRIKKSVYDNEYIYLYSNEFEIK